MTPRPWDSWRAGCSLLQRFARRVPLACNVQNREHMANINEAGGTRRDDRRVAALYVVAAILVASCTAQIGSDPQPTSGSNQPDAGPGPSPSAPDASIDAYSCGLQQGNYREAFTTSTQNCPAITDQTVAVDAAGTVAWGAGCTATATAACVTTIACSNSSGQTMTTSMLVVTTSGVSATGTATIETDTAAPPGCSTATIFCPPGYCLYGGSCYPLTYSQTCTYDVTFTRL
jgi:hypothetical protein